MANLIQLVFYNNETQRSRYHFEWLLGAILALLIGMAATKPIGDFGNYYYGSLFLLNGSWGPWVYDPASFNLRIYELGQRMFFLDYTAVPPFSAFFYLPFAWMPVMVAKLIWNILNGCLLILTFHRMHTVFKLAKPVLFGILLVLLIPIRNNFNDGQSYLLICYLLIEGLIQYQKGNTWMMALAWAICIHLKISPLIVFAFLVVNQQYKAMLQLACMIALCLGVSLPFIGGTVWEFFLREILPRLADGEVNNPYATSYQSAQVLFKNVFVQDALLNPEAPFHQPWLYAKLVLLIKVSLLLMGLSFSFGGNSKQEQFGMWMLIMLLASGYGNSFSLIFLLMPAAFFFERVQQLPRQRWLIMICLLATTLIPYYWYDQWPLPLRYFRLYSLVCFTVFLFVISPKRLPRFWLVVGLLALLLPSKKHTYLQTNLLHTGSPLLVYDFSVDKNMVELNVFDFNGPSVQRFALPDTAYKVEVVKDTLQTWKRVKCVMINDTLELYLSDVNRGPGLYTVHRECKN